MKKHALENLSIFDPHAYVGSSVARGGSSPPIGLKSMQNTLFLALLRPIFALNTKIVPPMILAMRVGQEPDEIPTRKSGF